MSFKALSQPINFEQVKSLSKLTPKQAQNKAIRDQELRDIIEGKSEKILLVIGVVPLIMKRRLWNMSTV